MLSLSSSSSSSSPTSRKPCSGGVCFGYDRLSAEGFEPKTSSDGGASVDGLIVFVLISLRVLMLLDLSGGAGDLRTIKGEGGSLRIGDTGAATVLAGVRVANDAPRTMVTIGILESFAGGLGGGPSLPLRECCGCAPSWVPN